MKTLALTVAAAAAVLALASTAEADGTWQEGWKQSITPSASGASASAPATVVEGRNATDEPTTKGVEPYIAHQMEANAHSWH